MPCAEGKEELPGQGHLGRPHCQNSACSGSQGIAMASAKSRALLPQVHQWLEELRGMSLGKEPR